MAIGTYVSINKCKCINCSTKRHRLAECIQKKPIYIYICCLQENHFRPKDTNRLIVRGWKNILHVNGKQKKAGVAILITDKTDLKIKITRDKERHYNDQGLNPRQRHNSLKYLWIQQRSTSKHKTKLTDKRRNWQ